MSKRTRTTLPIRLEQHNPTSNEDRATTIRRSARLKYAGDVVAELELSAADWHDVEGAPAGARFVHVFGSLTFGDADEWRVRAGFAVADVDGTQLAAPVVYNYHEGPNRPKGYTLVTPDHVFWYLFAAEVRPSIYGQRAHDAKLPRSWAQPLAQLLGGICADYVNAGSLWAESLRVSRWSSVVTSVHTYNRAAEELAGEHATYLARLAAARQADAYDVTTGRI